MKQTIKGVDVFLIHQGIPVIDTAKTNLKLSYIFNRGTQVYPGATPSCHLTDVHQCRFESKEGQPITLPQVRQLLESLESQGHHWCQLHQIYDL